MSFEGDGVAYFMRALIGVVAGLATPLAALADPSSPADARALEAAAFASASAKWSDQAEFAEGFALERDGDPLTGLQLESGRLTQWRTEFAPLSDTDRLRLTVGGRLRGADGAPLAAADRLRFGDPEQVDVAYLRDWPSALRVAGGGYALDVTPTAGLSLGTEGGGAEAGATVRLGSDMKSRLNGLVRDGESFGDRPRWYLFAAASGRAVGYNLLRSGSGGWSREGMSTDKGSFIGDAQAGIAWRKGELQASFGYVHREVKAYDYEKDDGFVAFQLSLKPQ